MSHLIEEAQRYERERARMESCRLSTVQPVNCIVLNSAIHSGVVTHVCAERRDHATDCRCACGFGWKGKK